MTDNYLNFNERVRHLENNAMGSDIESESKMKIRITSDSPRAAKERLNRSRQNSDRARNQEKNGTPHIPRERSYDNQELVQNHSFNID
jgi:hypothetical protein